MFTKEQLALKIKKKDLFWLIYFIIIALPLHQSNGLLGYLSITGMVSIFHILMIFLSAYTLTKGRLQIHHVWQKLLYFIFLLSIALGVIIGIKNSYQLSNVLGDGGMYLLSFMFLICSSSSATRKKDLNEFLLCTYKACNIMVTISAIMYFTRSLSFWQMISFNEGRYFGGFLQLLIITIPYGIYDHMHIGNVKLRSLIYQIILGFFCIMIAQSRALLLACVAGSIFVIYFGNRKLSIKTIIQVIILSAVALVALSMLMNSSLDIIGRLLSTDFTNKSDNSYARLYLYQYYFQQLKNHPFGNGFGSIMYFLTPQLNLMTNTGTYTVDAALMAAAYKGGWLLFFVYYVSMVYEIVFLILRYRKTKDSAFLIMIVCQTLFIVSTGLISGQIIHTYGPLVYFWTFMGFCVRNDISNNDVLSSSLHDYKRRIKGAVK